MNVIFRRVRERDIDLLLLEELCCTPEFLKWFFERVTNKTPTELTLVEAKHSVFASLGQTDIELAVDDAGRRFVFLIENKVGRTKQPRQSARYAKRHGLYPESDCRVVLVTPKRFATESFVEEYPSVVWLEDVLDWLRRNGAADVSRNLFKIELLSQALVPVPLPAHRNFRAQYFELSHLPEYRALNLPSEGGSIAFRPDGLPPRVRFVHRMRQGRVELIFRGKRNELNRVRAVLDSIEHDGLKVWTYPTASAIFTEVPEVHRDMDFEPQKATQALDAALRLWGWFRQNQDAIMASVS
jgi:hypothetical protein